MTDQQQAQVTHGASERRHRIFDTVGWLFFDRAMRLLIGVFVVAWTARYLGPAQFGMLNYAIAYVAIFGSVATLGLQGVVVRDLVRERDGEKAILGTAFVLQATAALLTLPMILGTLVLARPDEDPVFDMAAILAACLVFQSATVIKYWYESNIRSRPVVWVEQFAFLLTSAAKVALITLQASLIFFAWVALLESVIVAVGLLSLYAADGQSVRAWTASTARARALLADAWPLALSGLVVILFMRIDQVMLGQLAGEAEVGVFAAAVRIVEAVYVVPMAIMTSVFPALVSATAGPRDQEAHFQALYSFMFALSILMFALVFLLADWIVSLLFGPTYAPAAGVIRIMSFSIFLVTFGLVNGRWLLTYNLQRFGLAWATGGVVINVLLNLYLIPRYQAAGAAAATVATQAFSAVLFNGLSGRTRASLVMQARALVFRDITRVWRIAQERRS